MHHHRKFLGAAAVAALVLAAAPGKPAGAAVVLDQSSLGGPFGFGAAIMSIQSLAQSFTVGTAGKLDHIDVELYGTNNVSAPLVFNLLGVAGGLPDGSNVLATITLVPADVIVGMYSFDVSGDNIAVTVGQTLAFSLSSTTPIGPGDYPSGGYINGYAGGQAFTNCCVGGITGWHDPIAAGTDMHFQTFVEAPEPVGLGVGYGLAALLLLRRRRNRDRRA